MKSAAIGLQSNVVTIYDKTKTTLFGRTFQKTINSQSVLGPPLSEFLDIQTVATLTPSMSYFNPNTNRLFIINATAATTTLALYNFNVATGVYSFVGKLAFLLPNVAATAHTIRSFTANDNGATWDLVVVTTGSVLINAGKFLIHKVTAADFVPTGFATLPAATGSDQKAVYFLQDPAAPGAAHVQTTGVFAEIPWQSSNVAINTKSYLANNTTTPQFFVYDLAGTPTVSGIQTGTTITIGAPGVVTTLAAHGFLLNDQVTFTAGTLPTGLSLNTVYFVTATSLTSTTFTVAATSGGAAITTTVTAGSGITVMRAFGICTNLFSFKTGVLPTVTALLQNNSGGYCMPTVNANATLNGQDCFFFAAASQLYMGKISELTNGAVTWPSLLGINQTGTGIDITAPTVAFARYSTFADVWVYVTNTSTFVLKKHLSSQISQVFGGLSNQYLETTNPATIAAAVVTIASINVHGGWLFIIGSTVGQRGIIAVDLRSDNAIGYSYLTSPVTATLGWTLKFFQTIEQLFDYTDSLQLYYKTAATSSDATFNSPTTGWTAVANNVDLSAITLSAFTQFKIGFYVTTLFANSPAQVQELFVGYTPLTEMSDKWEGSVDNTSINGASPSYTAFRMITSDSGKKYFRAVDDSGNIVASANTTDNFALFDKSTNNGTSWAAMASANDYSSTALTTEIRYKWATPPSVKVTCTLGDS